MPTHTPRDFSELMDSLDIEKIDQLLDEDLADNPQLEADIRARKAILRAIPALADAKAGQLQEVRNDFDLSGKYSAFPSDANSMRAEETLGYLVETLGNLEAGTVQLPAASMGPKDCSRAARFGKVAQLLDSLDARVRKHADETIPELKPTYMAAIALVRRLKSPKIIQPKDAEGIIERLSLLLQEPGQLRPDISPTAAQTRPSPPEEGGPSCLDSCFVRVQNNKAAQSGVPLVIGGAMLWILSALSAFSVFTFGDKKFLPPTIFGIAGAISLFCGVRLCRRSARGAIGDTPYANLLEPKDKLPAAPEGTPQLVIDLLDAERRAAAGASLVGTSPAPLHGPSDLSDIPPTRGNKAMSAHL